MKRPMLIAAITAMTIQPRASLPFPSKQTGRDHAASVIRRIAPTGCAVDARSLPVGVWHPAQVRPRRPRVPVEIRQRTARVHDRCVPRRECFTDQRPVTTRRVLDSPFRTPPFLGK